MRLRERSFPESSASGAPSAPLRRLFSTSRRPPPRRPEAPSRGARRLGILEPPSFFDVRRVISMVSSSSSRFAFSSNSRLSARARSSSRRSRSIAAASAAAAPTDRSSAFWTSASSAASAARSISRSRSSSRHRCASSAPAFAAAAARSFSSCATDIATACSTAPASNPSSAARQPPLRTRARGRFGAPLVRTRRSPRARAPPRSSRGDRAQPWRPPRARTASKTS